MKKGPVAFNLDGKVAVVIGGGGYLCSTLAGVLNQAGADIVILDQNRISSGSNGQDHNRFDWIRCNVTSKTQLERCREKILKKHKRVDILLNGAGANAPTPFLKITKAEIDNILSVNLVGTLFGCQVFGEQMILQKSGSIINFASVSSGPPLSKAFVYSAAKAGVANLTQNLAREWARYQVRVNALKPGFFPTEWSLKHFIDSPRKKKILSHTPMERFGRPEELAGAVLWLASDTASFVTGSIVSVDGGFTAMTI